MGSEHRKASPCGPASHPSSHWLGFCQQGGWSAFSQTGLSQPWLLAVAMMLWPLNLGLETEMARVVVQGRERDWPHIAVAWLAGRLA